MRLITETEDQLEAVCATPDGVVIIYSEGSMYSVTGPDLVEIDSGIPLATVRKMQIVDEKVFTLINDMLYNAVSVTGSERGLNVTDVMHDNGAITMAVDPGSNIYTINVEGTARKLMMNEYTDSGYRSTEIPVEGNGHPVELIPTPEGILVLMSDNYYYTYSPPLTKSAA